MSFTDRLLSGLEVEPEFCKVRKKDGYVTGAARFPASMYSRIREHVDRKLEPILPNGEKIVCILKEGEIVDCGVKQFTVKKGVFMEVYDYAKSTAIFIRLYVISHEEEEWLALYIDENPSTPWWGGGD